MTRAILVVLVMLLVGCSHFVPNVPVTAPAGYTPAQVDSDEHACAKARRGQEHPADAYAACMISKGYATYFQVGTAATGQDYGNVVVGTTAPHPPKVIASDLRECETYAKRKEASGVRQVIRLLVAPPFDNPHRAEMVAAFRECMGPRGYTVDQWEPERK